MFSQSFELELNLSVHVQSAVLILQIHLRQTGLILLKLHSRVQHQTNFNIIVHHIKYFPTQ